VYSDLAPFINIHNCATHIASNCHDSFEEGKVQEKQIAAKRRGARQQGQLSAYLEIDSQLSFTVV
jgi:hypothetical protein